MDVGTHVLDGNSLVQN